MYIITVNMGSNQHHSDVFTKPSLFSGKLMLKFSYHGTKVPVQENIVELFYSILF